jgi:hypothetical protein
MKADFRGLEPANAGKGFFQNGFFCRKLGIVGKVLQGTAPAAAKQGAGRLNTQGRGLQDFRDFRPGPPAAFFGYAQDSQIAGRGKIDKNAFAFDPGQPCSAGCDTLDPGSVSFSLCHRAIL